MSHNRFMPHLHWHDAAHFSGAMACQAIVHIYSTPPSV